VLVSVNARFGPGDHAVYYRLLRSHRAWEELVVAQKQHRDQYLANPEEIPRPRDGLQAELCELLWQQPHQRPSNRLMPTEHTSANVARGVETGDWSMIQRTLRSVSASKRTVPKHGAVSLVADSCSPSSP
jgi:hypothetical protein